MRKLIAFVCIASVALAGSALATNTRVLTMGETGPVLMDESNITMYPQTLRMYPDRGLSDITGGAIHMMGVHHAFDNFVLGGYWTIDDWANPYLPAAFGSAIDQKLSLYYARDLAGMPFGFGFHLYGNSNEALADDATQSGMGIKINAGMTFMETLETGLTFGMLSFEEKDGAGATTMENEGGTQIMVTARWWHEMGDNMLMVPHFMFDMTSGGMKDGAGASTKDDNTTIDLGIGSQMKIGDMGLMVHDIGVMFWSRNLDVPVVGKTEFGMNFLPYFRGGLEAPLSEHFTIRFGGVKEWDGTTQKDPNGDEGSTGGANTRFYVGAGYNRGPFTLDMNLDPGFFQRGPYLISGAGGSLASMVSMRYFWGM